MSRKTFLLALIATSFCISVSLISCFSTDTRAADETAIRATDQKWAATAAKNDLDGSLAFYSDDAVLLPPNAPIDADKDSIRQTWSSFLSPGNSLSWQVSKVEVAKSSDLAYLYGTYSAAAKDPTTGASTNEIGKFVQVWKKQSGNNWKCIVETYNSDQAAPAPTPPAATPKKITSSSRPARRRHHHHHSE